MPGIDYRLSPALSDKDLNALFAASWPDYTDGGFQSVLARSLVYVGAFDDGRLIGYVNVAWDGGIHAFLLEPTVHPSYRRRGIGRELVARAAFASKERGAQWLHVDYEVKLEPFYRSCGFRSSAAGVMRLTDELCKPK